MKEVIMYQCNGCNNAYDTEKRAYECEFVHAREKYANSLWESGLPLRAIKHLCGFHWSIRDELNEVTKDNCFIVSHWQCCDKPAYKITGIDGNGFVHLHGKGGWSGYYGGDMPIDRLPKPCPPEELYVYTDYA